ncbi:MAG: serine/threonine protein kinase [Vulcanimicrobiota bacterium]
MKRRINASDGTVNKDGTPVTVLSDGALLSQGYKVKYQGTDEHCTIYKAMKGDRLYLVKEVHSSDREAVSSLTYECFVLEQFSHSGIQQSVELFNEDGWQYLVLEYIGGSSIDRIISPDSAVFMKERLFSDWASQLFDLFTYLQLEKRNGIYGETLVKKVIRNPKNIVRDKEGKIHLIDIGASPRKNEGKKELLDSSLLQPLAAPEFYEGKETDERSDVFTLGAIFYYLLSNGRGRDRITGVYTSLGSINSNISPGLEELIMKALQHDPDYRFPSIKAMKSAYFLLKFETEPDKGSEGSGKRPCSMKTAAALCTILAVVLFIIIFCAQKPAKNAATQGIVAGVAEMSPAQGLATPGSAVPLPSLQSDPMASLNYRQTEPPSIPSMAVSVPSAAPSVPSSPEISPSLSAAAPNPDSSAPPSLISLHYPTGAPQTGRHFTSPSEDPTKQAAAIKNENISKEERLAQYVDADVQDLEPARNIYRGSQNDYSIMIPSGYYQVRKNGANTPFFATIDEKGSESSFRMIKVTSHPMPDTHNFDYKQAASTVMASLITSGAEMVEQKLINTKGNHPLYEAYSFTYRLKSQLGPQPESSDYIYKECFFCNFNNDRAYRLKFCAPTQSFGTYESSEFSNTLRSFEFTYDKN